MKRFLALTMALSLLVAGCGQQKQKPEAVSGSYKVVTSESNINFTSIKNHDIGVSGIFEDVTGSATVPKDGNVTGTSGKIKLNLSSLNTGLKVRDQRVLKHFFETDTGTEDAKYSRAVFKIEELRTNGTKQLKKLNKSIKTKATGTLNIHGEAIKQTMNLMVTRTAKNEVRITTRKPYVFNIEKFGMIEPLEKLMEVCGHKDISLAVPININLTLRHV